MITKEELNNAIQLMVDDTSLFITLDIDIRREVKKHIYSLLWDFHKGNDDKIVIGPFTVKRLSNRVYSLYFENKQFWIDNYKLSTGVHFQILDYIKHFIMD